MFDIRIDVYVHQAHEHDERLLQELLANEERITRRLERVAKALQRLDSQTP